MHWPEKDGTCSCRQECGSVGKHPLTKHGVLDATTKLPLIRGWWDRWPQANLAIATGMVSKLWVLDFDGPEGMALLKDPVALGIVLHPPHVLTPGGGAHLYFAWPKEGVVRNATRLRGLPVDVRGEGGYVVAPPSHGAIKDYTRYESHAS